MSETHESARIPLQISRNCIVASVQLDLRPHVLASFRTDLLDLLGKSGAQAVVIDLAGLQTIDQEEFDALRQTSDMARLMGARSVLSGLNPGVVSSLVDLDVDLTDVEATRTLDAAFELIEADGGVQTGALRNHDAILDDDDADDFDPE